MASPADLRPSLSSHVANDATAVIPNLPNTIGSSRVSFTLLPTPVAKAAAFL